MTELLTAAEMRAVEKAAIDSGAVTGLELMERAGRGVVEAVLEAWPEMATAPGRAVVLCGPGNNGGDGFVIARLLGQRGWDVEVFLYGDAAGLPPDARTNHERWLEIGAVVPLSRRALAACDNPGTARREGVVIDALFGTGLTRPIDPEISRGIRDATTLLSDLHLVCVDIQSGLCSDSGRFLGGDDVWLTADLTVTFHRSKNGHYLCDGPGRSGRIKTVDIGLGPRLPPVPPLAALAELRAASAPKGGRTAGGQTFAEPAVGLVDEIDHDLLGKASPGHKYTHGHALVLSGGAGHTGAARLAARGALRIGAGLVTLGVPGAAQMEVAAQVTAVMLRRVDSAEALAEALADERINALCLGPGLGVERARPLALAALAAKRGTVLDADALTAFRGDPETLFAALHRNCVLTPHGGEFARLFPDIAGKLAAPAVSGPAYSKVDATREAAARAGCVVLHKGADTVIADPSGRAAINSAHYDRAAPWLATAGSGDVLAGFIAGLLARGFEAMQAAETAAFCHVECARSFGAGLIAEDLPEELPRVLRGLGIA